MPEIKITKFETISDGMYRFKVTSAELRTSENAKFGSGEFIGWQLLVMAGPNPDAIGKMINNATGIEFGNKSAAYRFLCALCMPAVDKVVSINTDDYICREFVGRVKEIEKDCNKSNKIEEFYSIDEYRVLQSQNLVSPPATQPIQPIQPVTQQQPVVPQVPQVPPVDTTVPPVVGQPLVPAAGGNDLTPNLTPTPPTNAANADDLTFPKG